MHFHFRGHHFVKYAVNPDPYPKFFQLWLNMNITYAVGYSLDKYTVYKLYNWGITGRKLILDFFFSDANAKRDLGYTPIVPKERAMAQTIEWVRTLDFP